MKLPKGWSEVVLADVVDFRNGKAHENIIDETGEYYVVNSKFISSEGRTFKLCKEPLSPLYKDDIVMVMSDIPNGKALAKCFFIPVDNKYTLNQRICSFKATRAYAKYLYYCLNRNKYFLGFDTGVGQTNLRKEEILDCPVLLPPIAEQRKIAQILSTWDSAIETIERLIDIKTHLKEALMQKLLTGKIRFRKFQDKWVTKKIKELGKVVSGGTPDTTNSSYWEGNVNWCTPTDITGLKGRKYIGETTRKITESGFKNSSATRLPKYSVIVCTRATIGECAINTEEMTTNQGFKSIVSKGVDYEFLYYLMASKKHLLKKLGNGSTFLEVSKNDFENIELTIPDEDSERAKIGQALACIDNQIAFLLDKLNLFQKQKQSLMQKLLTGKIRVKV